MLNNRAKAWLKTERELGAKLKYRWGGHRSVVSRTEVDFKRSGSRPTVLDAKVNLVLMSTFLRNHNFDVLSSGEMNEKN
jgi:hypothetical protein